MDAKKPVILPYQFGIWTAKFIIRKCVLCGVNNSTHNHINDRAQKGTSNPLFRLNTGFVCKQCNESLPKLTNYLSITSSQVTIPLTAFSSYQYPISSAIVKFKLAENNQSLPFLIHLIQKSSRPRGCHANNSVIVPMPTTKRRLTARGFDAVDILSRYLSKHWDIPIWYGVMRTKEGQSQKTLNKESRQLNVMDAFSLISEPPVKNVLLFDDVVTTGATMAALANAFIQSSHIPSNIQKQTNQHQLNIRAFCLAKV